MLHYWEIRSSNNLLVTSFTGLSFNYLPTNINTYNTPSLKIRHVVTCGGNLVFDNTSSYTFLNQGIFAGDPIVVNDQVPLNLTSVLNNNQPVFPGNNWLGNLKIYLYGLLQVTSTLTIDGADISVLPCEGIDVGSGGNAFVILNLNNARGNVTGNVRINQNTITNCPTGIRAFSNSNLSLFALSNTITNGSTGIFAGTCLAADISDNTISGENLGILVQQTPGCIVFHNTMSNNQVGLRFVGDCNSPEHVTCNIFNNCATGLLIDAGGRIGQQTSAGNRWMSPGYQAGTLIGAQHNGSNTDIMQSVFFTPQSGVQFPFTIVVTPPNLPTDWFKPGAASSTCPAFTGDGTDDRSEQSADVASELQLFPNPNDGSFSLRIGRLADTETAAVSIYDLSGKLVRKLETSQSDLNLNLGPQAAGWYILSVQTSNAATIRHIKFFIQ